MKKNSLGQSGQRRKKKASRRDVSGLLVKCVVVGAIVIYVVYSAIQLLIFSKKLF